MIGVVLEDTVISDEECRRWWRSVVVVDRALALSIRNGCVRWTGQVEEEGFGMFERQIAIHEHRDRLAGIARVKGEHAVRGLIVGGGLSRVIGGGIVDRHRLAAGGRKRDREGCRRCPAVTLGD